MNFAYLLSPHQQETGIILSKRYLTEKAGDDFEAQSKLIEDISTSNSFPNTLRTPDRVERIRMSAPLATMFSTLGVKPMLGRTPVAEDEDNVAVLSLEDEKTVRRYLLETGGSFILISPGYVNNLSYGATCTESSHPFLKEVMGVNGFAGLVSALPR